MATLAGVALIPGVSGYSFSVLLDPGCCLIVRWGLWPGEPSTCLGRCATCNLSWIRGVLMTHTLVTSRLDYCRVLDGAALEDDLQIATGAECFGPYVTRQD